jgi:hypothetical protein
MTTAKATTITVWIHCIMTGVVSAVSLLLGYHLHVCDGLWMAMLWTVLVPTLLYAPAIPPALLGMIGFGAAVTLSARGIA